jgi:hypothetical protein
MSGQPGFFDSDERLKGLSVADDPLQRLERVGRSGDAGVAGCRTPGRLVLSRGAGGSARPVGRWEIFNTNQGNSSLSAFIGALGAANFQLILSWFVLGQRRSASLVPVIDDIGAEKCASGITATWPVHATFDEAVEKPRAE